MGIKEKVLMIVTIILLVIMIGMACYSLYNRQQEDTDGNHNIINEIDLNETNKTNAEAETEENETDTENVVNENIEPVIQPNVTEEEINSDYVGTEEQETVTNGQTEEETVIELVKKQYGTDQGVTFNIANKDGNVYHVSVNDANTTAVIAWYSVDISNNTVTQQ